MNGTLEQQFEQVFQQDGLGRAEDRLAILDAFLGLETHVTAHEMADLLREQAHPLAEDYVRSVLRLFCNYGLAAKREFQGRDTTYEHLHLGEHHDHLLCVKCGAIQEFTDDHIEDHQRQLAQRYGFRSLRHRMEIYGLCAKCAVPTEQAFPLAMATAGERGVVAGLRGGSGVQRRLADLGIRPGVDVLVINSGHPGPFIVALKDTRVALDHGLARKVMVAPADNSDS